MTIEEDRVTEVGRKVVAYEVVYNGETVTNVL